MWDFAAVVRVQWVAGQSEVHMGANDAAAPNG